MHVQGSFKRNQRSQSVMNFLDFERYVQDDSAAGKRARGRRRRDGSVREMERERSKEI